jgi:nicotinamidase-related amidase
MKPALLVVDMQNDFVMPDAPACVKGALATVPRVRAALDHFRLHSLPIFHAFRGYRADGSDVEGTRLPAFKGGHPFVVLGTPGAEIVAALAPLPGEYRIAKPRFSAFLGTPLDFILRRLAVSHVVICGTQYPHCIRATAYDAISFDYAVTILTDATSAASPAVEQANIHDMRSIGIRCVTLEEFSMERAKR